MTKVKKEVKIRFAPGIRRINFPVLYPTNFIEEIRKVEKLNLPKHDKIGFEWYEYKGKFGHSGANVYIEKLSPTPLKELNKEK